MKYWITYTQFLGSGCEGDMHKIIAEHPLLWAMKQPANHYNSAPTLKNWQEIPDDVAALVNPSIYGKVE